MNADNSKADKNKYEDLLNLPHHESRTHPRMPMEKRAAQFLPFAALSGYGEVIRDTARKAESNGDYEPEDDWQPL